MYVGRGRTHPSCCIGASLQQFLYPIQRGVAKIKIPTLVIILQHEVFFITSSGYNKQGSVTSCASHTRRLVSDNLQKQCISTLDVFATEPILHQNKPAQYKHSASSSSSLSLPHPSSSSGPEEVPNSLDGENGFTLLLPVFTTGLIGYFFVLFCCFPSVAYYVSRKGTYDK